MGSGESAYDQSSSRSSGAEVAAKRIAIVGGGLAGLAAAVGLAGRGLHIELFEARRQLGGRATSFRDPASGAWVDHCQHVSLGCCTNLDDFCRRTGLIELIERHPALYFFGPDGRRCDVKLSRWLPAPLHLLPSFWRMKYLSRRERLGIVRALRALARASLQDDPSGPTIGQWLRAHRQSERAIELFWTPVIVSALSETLDRAAVPAARKVFVDVFLGQRQACEMQTPRVPLGEFYGTRLENWFKNHGIIVRRECAVKQVVGDTGQIRAVELADENTEPFDAVIIAAAWRRVPELVGESLRASFPELAGLERLESAPITAVHLWFDRPITDLPHAVLPGRTSQWMFNHGRQLPERSPEDVGHYYQIVISASRDVDGRPRNELIELVRHELASIWPEANAAKLLQARVVTEQHAVFSPLPGAEQLRPPQQSSVPNLFFAGDWTATGWPATMEGAVRSGYLAAERVLSHVGRPANVFVPELPRPKLAKWLGL